MKKLFFVLVSILVLCSISPAFAAEKEADLPNWFTYTKEWVALNLFAWKAESKLVVLDRHATERVENIQSASQNGVDENIVELADRYLRINERERNMIQKKNIAEEKIDMVMAQELERQRILSLIRQEIQSENVKNKIVEIQETAVNNTKIAIEKGKSEKDVNDFENSIVASWRDPKGEIDASEEKATRVYAEGTTAEGTIDEEISGIIIDGGEAKIVKNSNDELKIEYAPGTGPSSVTSSNGRKVWKIQMSDGSIVESYTSGSNVVIGQSTGVSSNVIVNTVEGGASSSAQHVVGESGGTPGVVVEGGNPGVRNSAENPSSSNSVNNVVE